MERLLVALLQMVHCRIGSLEKANIDYDYTPVVHCRIGSLEIQVQVAHVYAKVHCRIGSLEIWHSG